MAATALLALPEEAPAGPIIAWADDTPNAAAQLLGRYLGSRRDQGSVPVGDIRAGTPIEVGVGGEGDGFAREAGDRDGADLSKTLLLEGRLAAPNLITPPDDNLMNIHGQKIIYYDPIHAYRDDADTRPGLWAGGLEATTLGVLGAGGSPHPADPLVGPAPVEARRAGEGSEQFVAFWALALLGPPILAIAGLGSAELWFAVSVRLWLAGAAVLAVVVVVNSQGAGALWYAMAEFLTPITLLGGLGSGLAGLFAWKISSGTSGTSAKGLP